MLLEEYKSVLKSLGDFRMVSDVDGVTKSVIVAHQEGKTYFVVLKTDSEYVIVDSPFKFEEEGRIYALDYNQMVGALALFEGQEDTIYFEEKMVEDVSVLRYYSDNEVGREVSIEKYLVPVLEDEVKLCIQDMLDNLENLKDLDKVIIWDSQEFLGMSEYILNVLSVKDDETDVTGTGEIVYLREDGMYTVNASNTSAYVSGDIPIVKAMYVEELSEIYKAVKRSRQNLQVFKDDAVSFFKLPGIAIKYNVDEGMESLFDVVNTDLIKAREAKSTRISLNYFDLLRLTKATVALSEPKITLKIEGDDKIYVQSEGENKYVGVQEHIAANNSDVVEELSAFSLVSDKLYRYIQSMRVLDNDLEDKSTFTMVIVDKFTMYYKYMGYEGVFVVGN